jgi:iodotyrosine deiodinase
MTDKAYDPQPLNFERLSPDEQLTRSRKMLATLCTRRTIRDFSTAPVLFELIANAVATAATAPSGANQQPWTFVVVSDPATKAQIREAAEAKERESYERRMSDEWKDAIAHLGTDWQKPHLTDAPYLIIVFVQSYALDANGERIKHYYATESVGIAVGMLLASLHTAGLATLTHTPSPMNFLRDVLGRPENERAFVVIPVGHPAPDATVPNITKKPLDEILVHIHKDPLR